MSAESNRLLQTFKNAVQEQINKSSDNGYDVTATVRRVEGDTAYVHIEGGYDETPVQRTIACQEGDTVEVRISNGRGFIVGNSSAPPTDDTTAIISKVLAQTAKATANEAKEIAEEALANSGGGGEESSYFWHQDGTGTHAGAHITPVPKDDFIANPAGGNTLIRSGGMYIRDGLTNKAIFSANGVQLGEDTDSHLDMDYHSMQLVDKEGNTYVWLSDTRDSDGITELIESWIGDGTQTAFSTSWDVDSVETVTIDAVETSAYTVSGNTITFTTAPADGAIIEAIYTSETREAKAFTLGQRSSGYVGLMSYSEGLDNVAEGYCSHAEGAATTANGYYSHAEGAETTASGHYAHAEGYQTEASGGFDHAEGFQTEASGDYAHAEGYAAKASGDISHAEGLRSEASGVASHANGVGAKAGYYGQTAIGQYNDNQSDSLFEVGNGSDDSNRSNAMRVDASGNVRAASKVYAGSNRCLTVADMANFIKTVTASATYSVAASSYQTITFSPTTPSGYTRVPGIVGINTGSVHVVPNNYLGAQTQMVVRNISTSAQNSKTAQVVFMYYKTTFS